MDKKTFGARLRELRAAANLTQQGLADKAAISQRSIANWELGHAEPGAFALLPLAAALGVEVAALLAEPEEVREPKKGRPPKAKGEAPEKPKDKPKGKGQ